MLVGTQNTMRHKIKYAAEIKYLSGHKVYIGHKTYIEHKTDRGYKICIRNKIYIGAQNM